LMLLSQDLLNICAWETALPFFVPFLFGICVFVGADPIHYWRTQGAVLQGWGVFHKIIHKKVAIPLPPYLQKPTRTTRQYHPRTWRRFVRIGSTGDQWKHSYWRTQGAVLQGWGRLVAWYLWDICLNFAVWIPKTFGKQPVIYS
jgi:hypothetical protein